MSDRYAYCKIFVAQPSATDVKALLAALFDREFTRNSMVLPDLIIDVRVNPDSDPTLDDFVRWPVLVELEAAGAGAVEMVDAAEQVLAAVWATGSSAIAACDFEDELPYAGGIRRPPTA